MSNEQEAHWATTPGDSYTARNRVDWRARIPFWRDILALTHARSAAEIGANAGWNLLAMRELDPTMRLAGVDVNASAVGEARTEGLNVVLANAAAAREQAGEADLAFTCGVLIHIAPENIESTMQDVISCSRRWVLAVEYADDKETEVEYRGLKGRLWRRPFGALYEGLGLKLMLEGEAEGFDDCHYWLFSKR